MKKIVWALPVVAACVFFCLPAWALQEIAAQASKILPEPPASEDKLWWVAIFLTLNAAIRTALSKEQWKLPTRAAPWRLTFIAIISAAEAALEGVQHHAAFKTIALTFLMLQLPTIVQEALKAKYGGDSPSSGSGGGSVGSGKTIPPPGDTLALTGDWGGAVTMRTVRALRSKVVRTPAAVGVAIGFCVLAAGCGWFKSNGCQLIRTAADVCDTVVIILPDGTEERVPTSMIAGVAMQARAMRLSGTKPAADGGADQ